MFSLIKQESLSLRKSGTPHCILILPFKLHQLYTAHVLCVKLRGNLVHPEVDLLTENFEYPILISKVAKQATHFPSFYDLHYFHLSQKIFPNILTILLQLLFIMRNFREETECWRLQVRLWPTDVESQHRWAVINPCHILTWHSSQNWNIAQFPKPPMQSTLGAHVITLKCPPRAQPSIQGLWRS